MTMEKVQEYISQLNPDTQELANKAIRDMREEGFKWTWLLAALQIKEPEEWERWGFGLLFNDTFRAQVEKKLKRIRKQSQEQSSVWVRDDEEEDTYTLTIRRMDDNFKTLEDGISSLLASLGLCWDEVLELAEKHLDISPQEKEILDAIPDEVISAPVEIEKDYSNAPKWFDTKENRWRDYDVSQFTSDTSINNPRISFDVRNVDTIKYAFDMQDIPAYNIDYFQRLLDAAEHMQNNS